MAENKTKQTEASVEAYFTAIDDEARRKDCQALARLMTSASREPARMWGTSIVGFGQLHYKYASGREGDTCVVGFASRKSDITLYGLNAAPDAAELLTTLGKYKAGKGCLYIKKMSDVDTKVLEKLVAGAFASRKNHDPTEA